MSEDDLFLRAARALRDSTDGSSARAETSRARVLASFERGGRRRRRALSILVPLAAALLVSTAWGAVTGRLPGWLGKGAARVEQSREAALPSPATPVPETTAPVAETSAPVAETSAPAPLPMVSSGIPDAGSAAPSSAPVALPSRAPPSSRPVSSVPSARTLVSAREQSLYASAHEAHFVGHDPAAALRGWEDYLAAYPDGRFALEARYNRAICPVRLHRHEEARAALTVFADETRGGYRQAEARELLNALDARDGGAPP